MVRSDSARPLKWPRRRTDTHSACSIWERRGRDGMILVLFVALAAAGLATGNFLHHSSNSMPLASPNLLFLGDIFAIPKSVPLSNVFSVGDVCVAAGAVLTLHRVSGSVLIPSGRGQFAPLFRK